MTRVVLRSTGIRLHPALMQRIEREAKAVRLRPTDYLRRRIEDAFAFDPDAYEIDENADTMLALDGED